MRLQAFFSRLLMVFAIMGLLGAPLTQAGATGMPAFKATVMTADMASIHESMPCCPHQKQLPSDCYKNCLFAALCAAQCATAIPSEAAVLARILTRFEPFLLSDDPLRAQGALAPPQRPPRI